MHYYSDRRAAYTAKEALSLLDDMHVPYSFITDGSGRSLIAVDGAGKGLYAVLYFAEDGVFAHAAVNTLEDGPDIPILRNTLSLEPINTGELIIEADSIAYYIDKGILELGLEDNRYFAFIVGFGKEE